MTARINVSGKLMMDPESTLIGGEAHAGAPMLVRMRVSPVAEGAVGPAVLFVTARGSVGDTLSGFRRGDVARVSGAVRLARHQDDGGERECFACEAESVEPAARH